jgi:hypothetical protein
VTKVIKITGTRSNPYIGYQRMNSPLEKICHPTEVGLLVMGS